MRRHAVILRRISFGRRTSEGSLAFADLLCVIETCRLRGVDPWDYIASVIANGLKDIWVPGKFATGPEVGPQTEPSPSSIIKLS